MKTAPLWSPAPAIAENSRMAQFMAQINSAFGTSYSSFGGLHEFSVREIEAFWSKAWDFFGVIGDRGDGPVFAPGKRFEDARFFEGARLSYAENLLRKNDDSPALIFWGENKVKRTLSWAGLHEAVSRAQQALRAQGVREGDRVAALMPNMPEAIVGLLAATSLGAIWSSASPDFGVGGVLDRFGQIEPRVLIACDGYYYNGKTIHVGDKVCEIVEKIPSIERALIVPYLGDPEPIMKRCGKAQSWDEALGAFGAKPVEFARLPFTHPIYILYSSGTTGTPKCIVHSAGGVLIQHMKEHQLHCDLRDGERLFYFTTLGWMMWNWLAGGLASGATLVLYDGSPFHPGGHILFDYADEARINVFGTSAKWIDSVKKAGLRPRDTHNLSSVRMITSTGSPLAPESFDFVYGAIKPDVQLASIAGGTDICSCFVLGNPLSPVYRGEIQGPGLGMAVDVFDDAGQHMSSGKGELVCTKPFPAIPVGFWNDPSGEKYHNAYFDRFPGVWHHGDFAEWTENGGIAIQGRSDATLNPGGVRIGTAEIYRQVEQLEEVREAIVIGQDWDNDVRVVLFVVLREGLTLDDELRQKIKAKIRSGASPRHVPGVILQVADIPRTKSGKITEIAVRDIVHGREVKNKEALANPHALDYYRDFEELHR
ncbi:MAG: acetoacetate--CoA ligase [Rhodomicrobium sp.]